MKKLVYCTLIGMSVISCSTVTQDEARVQHLILKGEIVKAHNSIVNDYNADKKELQKILNAQSIEVWRAIRALRQDVDTLGELIEK